MKDTWNLKDHMVMHYHHMLEEGVYPEDAIEILRKKLLNAHVRGELTLDRIHQLFGDIDTDHMRQFWEERAKTHEANEALTNLEDDAELLTLKVMDEERKILPYLDWEGKTILDLGSGYGNWAFKFIKSGAKMVHCVDYVKQMVDIGRKRANKNKIKNIHFFHSAIQDYKSAIKYDVIFIAGVSVHLNDNDYNKVVENMKVYSKKGTILILRDGTGIPKRHSFDKEWSERLRTYYSGIYRGREDYIALFKKSGFELLEDEDMFPEGHQLNRFPKTRLRLYKFKRMG